MKDGLARHTAHMSETINTNKTVVRRQQGRDQSGDPGIGGRTNIKMYLKEIRQGIMDWIQLA
jgi:hypothetical protein